MQAPIGKYPQLLCRLSRQRQKSGEPSALGGIIRPAQRQAESTAGADHDDYLRLAARASAPGSGRRSFASDGGLGALDGVIALKPPNATRRSCAHSIVRVHNCSVNIRFASFFLHAHSSIVQAVGNS